MPDDQVSQSKSVVPSERDVDVQVRPFIHVGPNSRSLHFSEKEIQSRMSTLNPDALDLEYTRMMMGFLLFNAYPQHIGMVGLGGGSLAKFCFRYLPASKIDVVEIDERVISMRDQFMVPHNDARFEVIKADGAHYIAAHPETFDVWLIDGYDRDGIPDQLCSDAFYRRCFDGLKDNGLLVANFHVNHPNYHDYLDRVRDVFGAAVMEVVDDDMTNSVVFACKGDLLDRADAFSLKRPDSVAKDAWRQLMPTFKVIAATHTLR